MQGSRETHFNGVEEYSVGNQEVNGSTTLRPSGRSVSCFGQYSSWWTLCQCIYIMKTGQIKGRFSKEMSMLCF